MKSASFVDDSTPRVDPMGAVVALLKGVVEWSTRSFGHVGQGAKAEPESKFEWPRNPVTAPQVAHQELALEAGRSRSRLARRRFRPLRGSTAVLAVTETIRDRIFALRAAGKNLTTIAMILRLSGQDYQGLRWTPTRVLEILCTHPRPAEPPRWYERGSSVWAARRRERQKMRENPQIRYDGLPS